MNSSFGAIFANRLVALLGTASFLAIAGAMPGQAQQVAQAQMAQTQTAQVPEQVLVTGSLIRGAAAVGVPVTSIGVGDFKETGSLTISDVLKNVPSVTITTLPDQGPVGTPGAVEVHQSIAVHNIGGETLLLFDGMRFLSTFGTNNALDPSIIPQLAVDRVDVLADGASATYGSDAMAGVVNIILKRGFDGAVTQFQVSRSTNGNYNDFGFGATQLYGRKWDSGDITATYEFDQLHNVRGPGIVSDTFNFTPWGLDNRTPIIGAIPGILSTGRPAAPPGTPVGFSANIGTTCSNCYSVPKGQNGVGLTWAQLQANPGVANEGNPYDYQDFIPWTQRNSAVLTFDQRIFPGVQFTAEGFYSNQRNIYWENGLSAPNINSYQLSIPTSNPYYPAGAPAGLMMAYNFNGIDQSRATTGSWDGRWEAGLNIDLPFAWNARLFFQTSEDYGFDSVHIVNPNLVTAALGGTVPATGNYASYTKPATVPYLNLLCDPKAFQCIDPATFSYINSHLFRSAHQNLNETGANFDGPLFDLPGGQVKAALGVDYWAQHWDYYLSHGDISDLGDIAPNPADEGRHYNLIAGFAQLNVPLVGETNGIPAIRTLNLELSGRIDHYDTVGTTTNPKASFTWDTGYGLSLRGTWGTSFRAPNFNDLSGFSGSFIQPLNIAAGNVANAATVTCPNGTVNPGSAAAQLGATCGSAPGGISASGGFGIQGIVHPGLQLKPEQGRNWAVGFDLNPADYLKGVDVAATFWDIKINNVIQGVPTLGGLNDPQSVADGVYITNKDPNFASIVARLLADPLTPLTIIPSAITFIQDTANQNVGWRLWQGIDFNASYDVDLGELGAWNTGIVGVYNIDQKAFSGPGTAVVDYYQGLNSGGRLAYRARLGWAGGDDNAYSVTLFMNYKPHIGNQPGASTVANYPACFMMGNPACNASGLPEFAQYTTQVPSIVPFQPSFITFDLSFGFNTGDKPANDYLKHIAFQLTIDDIMNRLPRFAYVISSFGGVPKAFNLADSPAGREVIFTITKTW